MCVVELSSVRLGGGADSGLRAEQRLKEWQGEAKKGGAGRHYQGTTGSYRLAPSAGLPCGVAWRGVLRQREPGRVPGAGTGGTGLTSELPVHVHSVAARSITRADSDATTTAPQCSTAKVVCGQRRRQRRRRRLESTARAHRELQRLQLRGPPPQPLPQLHAGGSGT